MDQFALYLVFRVGDSGKHLQKNTVAAYFDHVKVWLFSTRSGLHAATEQELNKMGHIIEKYIQKGETNDGTYVKKAPACTMPDLNALMETLCTHATRPVDCGDVAAICLI